MRKALIISLVQGLLYTGSISGQVTKKQEAAFRKTCYAVAEAFAKKNIATLNKYIDPHAGVYIITRPGAIDKAAHYAKITGQDEWMLAYPYTDPANMARQKLMYDLAPRFDCGESKWNKHGFIADSASKSDRLSALLSFRSQYEGEPHDAEELERVKMLEKTGRCVVFTEMNKGRGLVFYLAFSKKKWRLYLVDTVVGTCAA